MRLKLKVSHLLASALFCSIGLTQAAPVQWNSGTGANNHWYEWIEAGTSITWDAANTAAAAKTYLGQGGYLATVTTPEEQRFLVSLYAGQNVNPWIGASDATTEGIWRWVTGPEAGSLFSFTAWVSGEPNDYLNEDHLQMLFVFNGSNYGGNWNDLDGSNRWGMANGYLVEYSGVPGTQIPEPASLALLGLGLAGLGALRRRKQ